MSKLDRSPRILAMAAALKVGGEGAVTNIVGFCHRLVRKWCQEAGGVSNIDQVQQVVCRRLRLVFEEFHDLDELKAIIKKYVAKGEIVFASLINDFDKDTFATLLERRKIGPESTDRYVAVIDCRGEKAYKRYFSRWHEISHLLTLHDQLELPFHRTVSNGDPVERLMDIIAADVGFFSPLFLPYIDAEMSVNGRLTFDGVERIRQAFCPEASFQATLNACVARIDSPAVVVEAGWGWKKAEKERVENDLFGAFDAPQPKIRALKVRPNSGARGSLLIHENMEVPSSSVIARLLLGVGDCEFTREAGDDENLCSWEHSDGRCLANVDVYVEGRRVGDEVIALVQLR